MRDTDHCTDTSSHSFPTLSDVRFRGLRTGHLPPPARAWRAGGLPCCLSKSASPGPEDVAEAEEPGCLSASAL